MGQEFFINSQDLEDKVRQLLPSQGGLGAGFDLSASTQIIPIIDLTESAQGSGLRQDLQTSLSHGTVTSFSVENATTTLINNTGYYRVFGAVVIDTEGGASYGCKFIISDGSTDKEIIEWTIRTTSSDKSQLQSYDFVVFLEAGDSFKGSSNSLKNILAGCTRQIATITGELVNP